MSAWDDVHIRQNVDIAATVGTESYNFGSIVNRKSDNFFTFQMPKSKHSSEVFKKGVLLNLSIQTDKTTLVFSGEVAMLHPGNTISVQVNRPQEDQIKIRPKSTGATVRATVPLTYRAMRDPVTPISDIKKAKTVAIGTEDAIIALIQKINVGNYIEINYALPPDDVAVGLVGKVVDCSEIMSGAQVSYEAVVVYDVIREGEKDKIAKYIIQEQMRRRKTGMC